MKTETGNSKRRILIVDHDERIVEEIARGLRERENFEIHTFTTGGAAREALRDTTFDLLIAGRDLPEVDGVTLIHETQEHSPHTVTVLMTSLDAHGLAPLPENSTAHHYLGKPFAMAELVGVIDAIFPTQPGRVHHPHPLVLKVVLGGDANVGKTTLIRRYCTGEFEPTRAMTIGVDFHLYDMDIEGIPMRLSVWDLGGQERFNLVRRGFYRGARAVGLVYDTSNRTSFYNLIRWWREAREYLPDVPVLLLTNKIDLPRQVPQDEAREIAHAWNIPFFESSCATGQGVPEFFHALAYHALKYTQQLQNM